MSNIVEHGRKDTKQTALASENKNKIFFPTDDDCIIMGGKAYGDQTEIRARVQDHEQAIIFDVSSHNDGAVFESLSALLNNANLSTLIPASVRHGGMTIRFIQGSEQSSDNKYVEYFLTKDEWSASEADWEKMNLEEEVNQIEQSLQPYGYSMLCEYGWIDSSTGQNSDNHSDVYSRFIDYLPISSDVQISTIPSVGIGKRYYDSSKNFLGTSYNSSAAYLRIVFESHDIKNTKFNIGGVIYYTQKYKDVVSEDELLQKLSLYGAVGINCSTESDVAEKVVTLPNFTAPSPNMRLVIRFTNVNTADNVTLNINGTGAKPLYFNDYRASSTNSWFSDSRVDVLYNGSDYVSYPIFGLSQNIPTSDLSIYHAPSENAVRRALNTLENTLKTKLSANTTYIWCETAGSISEKEITLQGYEKTQNVRLMIRFRHQNTAENVTLNVNGTGAISLFYNGIPASPTNTWEDGEFCDVLYNFGAQYMAVTHPNVLQSTGTSKKDVMSQKAITDAIAASVSTVVNYSNIPSPSNKLLAVMKSKDGGVMWSDSKVWRWVRNNEIVTSAKAYKTVKVSDGSVINVKNESTVYPIASMTKVISALVACRYITNWNDTMTLLADDLTPEMRPNFVWTGDIVSYNDLLHAALILSDNNAAEAFRRPVGYLINPSASSDAEARQAFLTEMRNVCTELGMSNTSNFLDACSLVKSTVEDMCILFRYIQNNVSKITSIWGLASYQMNIIRDNAPYSYTINSTTDTSARTLIPEFLGGKTGTLVLQTYGFIWRSVEDNELYATTLLDSSARFHDARQIIDEVYSTT